MYSVNAASPSSASLWKTMAVVVGVACGAAAWASAARAEDAPGGDPKEQIVMLYMMQAAPKACKWENAGSSAKLDAKIADAEKSLGVTEEEKTKYHGMAEQGFKATSEDCDAKGMVRAMYDEAIK